MRTDRSLLKLILLSIITLGIYSLWFWSQYAKDMNTVCQGDGKTTRGILFRIILSILTLGIYDLVWMYGVGSRIHDNCYKYNIACETTGGSVLLWFVLGAAIIIGPFVAIHKMIDGLNRLCEHYNHIDTVIKNV